MYGTASGRKGVGRENWKHSLVGLCHEMSTATYLRVQQLFRIRQGLVNTISLRWTYKMSNVASEQADST